SKSRAALPLWWKWRHQFASSLVGVPPITITRALVGPADSGEPHRWPGMNPTVFGPWPVLTARAEVGAKSAFLYSRGWSGPAVVAPLKTADTEHLGRRVAPGGRDADEVGAGRRHAGSRKRYKRQVVDRHLGRSAPLVGGVVWGFMNVGLLHVLLLMHPS